MKKAALLALLILSQAYSFAQSIEIGQEANYVRNLAKWKVSEQNKSNPLKDPSKTLWEWNELYNDGTLIEVVMCYKNQYHIGFHITTDFCERYKMENNKLKTIILEFPKISLSSLKPLFIDYFMLEEVNNLYFTNNYNSYYKFYLSTDKIAIAELHLTVISELPNKMQDIILKKKMLAEVESVKKKQQEETERNRIINDTIDLKDFDIMSKTNLQSEFESAFLNEFLILINKNFNNYIVEIANKELDKAEKYSNTFTITYIQSHNKSGYPSYPKTVLSSVDKNDFIEIVKLIRPRFTNAFINNNGTKTYLNTKAEIKEFDLNIVRGKIDIKKTKNDIVFSAELNEDIKSFIVNELKEKAKGKYTIVYEVGNVNNYKLRHLIVLTDADKAKFKSFN